MCFCCRGPPLPFTTFFLPPESLLPDPDADPDPELVLLLPLLLEVSDESLLPDPELLLLLLPLLLEEPEESLSLPLLLLLLLLELSLSLLLLLLLVPDPLLLLLPEPLLLLLLEPLRLRLARLPSCSAFFIPCPGSLSLISSGSSEASKNRVRTLGFFSCCVRVGRLWYTASPLHSYVQWPFCRHFWHAGTPCCACPNWPWCLNRPCIWCAPVPRIPMAAALRDFAADAGL